MKGRFAAALGIATVLSAAATAQAQAQSSRPYGVAVGIAVDSIYGAPLRSAVIKVGETGAAATTDSLGRFRITGVPRGTHRVQVIHPLLDTLRLSLRTTPREFGDSTELIIATPSPQTVVSVKCTPQDLESGGAMALGFVVEAGSEEPVPGAMVRIEWADYEVKGKRLVTQERSQTAVTGQDGSYKMCGIPADLETGIFVVHGRDTTTTLRRNFAPRLAIASFKVAPAPSAAARPGEKITAVISGKVLDTLGRGVEGARIATDDGESVALTRADGTFELQGVEPGTRGINIRKLGFHPISQAVDVPPDGAKGVEIELAVYVPVLESVRITARRDYQLERIGFKSRSRSSSGRFLDPDQIDRLRPHRLTDLLRGVPSLRTYYVGGNAVVAGRRGECVRYYLDGMRWFENGPSPDEFLLGNEIGALEVYTGTTAPAQFSERAGDGSPCSIVMIWTKWKLRMR